jgi:hypothetical protein
MALVGRISIGRHGFAAIAAVVFTALAVVGSGHARGQDAGDQAGGPPAPEAEAMAPGAMQMMMGDVGDGDDAAALIGHGFRLDGDVFTTIDHPDAIDETAVLGINRRGQIVGAYLEGGVTPNPDGTVPPGVCTVSSGKGGASPHSTSPDRSGRNPSGSTIVARSRAGTMTPRGNSTGSCCRRGSTRRSMRHARSTTSRTAISRGASTIAARSSSPIPP